MRKEDVIAEYLERLGEAILNGDSEMAKDFAMKLKEQGVSHIEVIEKAIKPTMDEIGRKYERLEIFLPELVLAGEAAQEALGVLLPKEGKESIVKSKVVIGTIYGDIHDIGKNIVAAMLRASGYQVVDLGNDVPPRNFVEVAKKEDAKIIGISCLLTPSMYYMKDVIKRLKDEGLRERFFVIVGGAAVYPDWAKEIGADGWAKDAERAIQLCDMLLESGERLQRPVILGEWR